MPTDTATQTVEVQARLQDVRSLLRDVASQPEWIPEIVTAEVLESADDGLPVTARFTAAGEGSRGIALRFGQFYAPDATHTDAIVRLARRGMSMHVGTTDGYAPSISCDDAASAVVAALDAPAGVYNVVDDEPMTRRDLDAAMVAAVGGNRLVRSPEAALKIGGSDAAIFRMSNRASNARFKQATGWSPRSSRAE